MGKTGNRGNYREFLQSPKETSVTLVAYGPHMPRERNTPKGKEREFLNPKGVINPKLQLSSKSLGIPLVALVIY